MRKMVLLSVISFVIGVMTPIIIHQVFYADYRKDAVVSLWVTVLDNHLSNDTVSTLNIEDFDHATHIHQSDHSILIRGFDDKAVLYFYQDSSSRWHCITNTPLKHISHHHCH